MNYYKIRYDYHNGSMTTSSGIIVKSNTETEALTIAEESKIQGIIRFTLIEKLSTSEIGAIKALNEANRRLKVHEDFLIKVIE